MALYEIMLNEWYPNERHTAMNTRIPEPEYITPSELAIRWQCSRTSVDRYTRKAGLTRMYLGDGKNSLVRFLRKEVIAYEKERQV